MSNENETIEFALTKMLNSGIIYEDYPMIKEIIVNPDENGKPYKKVSI